MEQAVPFAVTVDVAFLPPGLPRQRWRAEVKRIVRTHLDPSPWRRSPPSLVDVYDESIQEIIREVVAEN